MRMFYIISIIILWFLIILQIPGLIKINRLLKRTDKGLEEVDELQEELKKATAATSKAQEEYEAERNKYIAKWLELQKDADEEISEEEPDDVDTPPQGEVFVYSHKNGKIILHAAHCDLEWLSAEVGYIAHRLYCGLMKESPEAAEMFRALITVAMVGEGSPTWDTSAANDNAPIVQFANADAETEETNEE